MSDENTELKDENGKVNLPDTTGKTQVPDTLPQPTPTPENKEEEPGRPGPFIGPSGFSLR